VHLSIRIGMVDPSPAKRRAFNSETRPISPSKHGSNCAMCSASQQLIVSHTKQQKPLPETHFSLPLPPAGSSALRCTVSRLALRKPGFRWSRFIDSDAKRPLGTMSGRQIRKSAARAPLEKIGFLQGGALDRRSSHRQ
jgi:hypothetical protein